MRIKNKTDIPNHLLEEIITFVRPNKIGQVSYDVGNRSTAHFSGSAWRSGKVLVKINPDAKYPFYHDIRGKPQTVSYGNEVDENGVLIWKSKTVRRNGGYLPSLILSRDESLVHIFAHELRHIWQNRHKGRRTGRVWGARGKFSERDCDAYAIRLQRKWRHERTPRDMYNQYAMRWFS